MGGLLVLFVYISSLSGNEPIFSYSFQGIYLIVFGLRGLGIFLDLGVEVDYYGNLDIFYCLVAVYFLNNVGLFFFLLFYLFFLLLVVSDLTKFICGSLKIVYG